MMKYFSKLVVCAAVLFLMAVLAGCSEASESEAYQSVQGPTPPTAIEVTPFSTTVPTAPPSVAPELTLSPTETPVISDEPDAVAKPDSEVTAPQVMETEHPPETSTDNSEISDGKIITSGVEYQFETCDLVAVSTVEPSVAAAIDSPHIYQDGQVETGWYVAFADITVTNVSAKDQYIMLNAVSIARVENGNAVMGTTSSMRYYDGGDSSSKQYLGVSIGAGEQVTAHVGFLVNKDHLGQGQIAFYINPDGVSPANDNTRVVPITITYQ